MPSPWHDSALTKCFHFANHQNQHKRVPSGNSQLPPTKRRVSVPAGERDYSQRVCSVASTIQGQNSIPWSLLNMSRVADITWRVTSTTSATQRRSMNTPTPTPGMNRGSTQTPGETSQTNSKHRVVSCPASGIAITSNPLTGLENLPNPIPNPEARAIITDPLWTWVTEKNQRQRQLQLQLQVVSTPRSMVFNSRSIHPFGHPDMTRLVFATGRVL